MINPLSVELPIQVSWSFPPPHRDSAGNVLFVYALCLMLNLEQVRSSNVSIVETDFMSHHNSSCVRVGNNGNRRTTELGFESMRVSDVEERREGWPEKKDEGVWKHGGRRRGVNKCHSLSAIVVESGDRRTPPWLCSASWPGRSRPSLSEEKLMWCCHGRPRDLTGLTLLCTGPIRAWPTIVLSCWQYAAEEILDSKQSDGNIHHQYLCSCERWEKDEFEIDPSVWMGNWRGGSSKVLEHVGAEHNSCRD